MDRLGFNPFTGEQIQDQALSDTIQGLNIAHPIRYENGFALQFEVKPANVIESIANLLKDIDFCQYYFDNKFFKDTPPQIGRGSYGAVYLYCMILVNNERDCSYALKMMDLLRDEYEGRERNALAQMKQLADLDLGYAPRVYHISVCDSFGMPTMFVVMDLIKASALHDVLVNGEFTQALRVKLIEQIDFMHNHGILHGDLGPDNIMLKDGHFIFFDFAYKENRLPVDDWVCFLYYLVSYYMLPPQLEINSLYEEVCKRIRDFVEDERHKKSGNITEERLEILQRIITTIDGYPTMEVLVKNVADDIENDLRVSFGSSYEFDKY